MKKLMMAVVIVCATVGAQAASIAWGNAAVSKIYELDGTTALAKDLNSFVIALVDSTGNEVATATIGMTAGVLAGSGLTYTYTYGTDYSVGDTFSLIAKMTVDGQAYEMAFGSYSITAVNDTGTDKFVWADGTYGGLADTGTAGSSASWAAVPEPTSGLLIALGLCGLALKRKRA